MSKVKKVVVNGEEVTPTKKVKLWEQDGYDRRQIRKLVVEKREALKSEEE